MTAWLPVTASVLAVTGITSVLAFGGGDCTHCSASASSTTTNTAAVATVETVEAEAGPTLEQQDVMVLKFHADWCGQCKSLNPVYSAMIKEFDDKPVGFVKLDVTNKESKEQTEKKIKELGLEDIWSKNKGRNGFLMIVDAETKKSVKVLRAGTTKEQASKAITAALDS